MAANYWTGLLGRRLSRRRALATTAGGVSAAAILAACGGSNDGGGEGKQASPSLLSKPVDTTSKAKRGGIMFLARANNPGDFDPLTGQGSMTSTHTSAVYSRLL